MNRTPSNFTPPHHYPHDTEKDHTLTEWQGVWCCSCRVQMYLGSTNKHDAASRHASHVSAVREIRTQALEVGRNGDGYTDNPYETSNEPFWVNPLRPHFSPR